MIQNYSSSRFCGTISPKCKSVTCHFRFESIDHQIRHISSLTCKWIHSLFVSLKGFGIFFASSWIDHSARIWTLGSGVLQQGQWNSTPSWIPNRMASGSQMVQNFPFLDRRNQIGWCLLIMPCFPDSRRVRIVSMTREIHKLALSQNVSWASPDHVNCTHTTTRGWGEPGDKGQGGGGGGRGQPSRITPMRVNWGPGPRAENLVWTLAQWGRRGNCLHYGRLCATLKSGVIRRSDARLTDRACEWERNHESSELGLHRVCCLNKYLPATTCLSAKRRVGGFSEQIPGFHVVDNTFRDTPYYFVSHLRAGETKLLARGVHHPGFILLNSQMDFQFHPEGIIGPWERSPTTQNKIARLSLRKRAEAQPFIPRVSLR